MRTASKDKAGFSLIEIVFATIVFSVGVLALMQTFSCGIILAGDAERAKLALVIAQAKMEEIRNMPFVGLVDSAPAADPDFEGLTTSVNVAEGANPLRMDVTVSWTQRGRPMRIVLTTYRTDY